MGYDMIFFMSILYGWDMLCFYICVFINVFVIDRCDRVFMDHKELLWGDCLYKLFVIYI